MVLPPLSSKEQICIALNATDIGNKVLLAESLQFKRALYLGRPYLAEL